MDRSLLPRRCRRRRRSARAALLVAGGLALVALLGGAVALALHPVTGPEIRDYLRDRYLRPSARLPERTW